ncbi:MAG: ATP-grasp domain-containing protein [Gammaproteobacteria bacterium]
MTGLTVIGASARAPAQSAARGALRPYWIDCFGDRDLAGAWPGSRIAPGAFPGALGAALAQAPMQPWMFGAPIENDPEILDALARLRPLAGNDAGTCAAVRDPQRLAAAFDADGIARPEIATGPRAGRWIAKPRASHGGIGVRAWTPGMPFDPHREFLQARIDGPPVAGLFLGDGRDACFVGVTAQIVGDAAFGAAGFIYCGSIGPLRCPVRQLPRWRAIGSSLARRFALRGLFGVDAILHRGVPIPIEVNPRYTAAVEVHERAGQPPLVPLHLDACAGRLPVMTFRAPARCAGKAYVFAPCTLVAPGGDAWIDTRWQADLPAAGQRIEAGAPIVTVFGRGRDAAECLAVLRARARRILRHLLPPHETGSE